MGQERGIDAKAKEQLFHREHAPQFDAPSPVDAGRAPAAPAGEQT
jgi:hypothetical protein